MFVSNTYGECLSDAEIVRRADLDKFEKLDFCGKGYSAMDRSSAYLVLNGMTLVGPPILRPVESHFSK